MSNKYTTRELRKRRAWNFYTGERFRPAFTKECQRVRPAYGWLEMLTHYSPKEVLSQKNTPNSYYQEAIDWAFDWLP